jgi:hypothetical protein
MQYRVQTLWPLFPTHEPITVSSSKVSACSLGCINNLCDYFDFETSLSNSTVLVKDTVLELPTADDTLSDM